MDEVGPRRQEVRDIISRLSKDEDWVESTMTGKVIEVLKAPAHSFYLQERCSRCRSRVERFRLTERLAAIRGVFDFNIRSSDQVGMLPVPTRQYPTPPF